MSFLSRSRHISENKFMRNILSYTLLILLLGILGISACKKGSIETNYNPNLQVANNQVIAERAYSEVFNLFFRVVSDTTLKSTGRNDIFGAECTYQDTNGIEYIIDYGINPANCPDGKLRKGKIIVTLDKDFWETGAVATLEFTDYSVDELKLTGDNSISHDDMGMNSQMTFIHEVPSSTITFYDSVSHGSIQWKSEKTFIWAEGMDTPYYHEDDVFNITGTSNGSDISNVAFSTVVDTALGDYFNCRWIRTGSTIINTPSLDVTSGYIDYIGYDTCSNLVVYYFNGNPFYDRID
jgi:hypothetical protein